MQAAIVAQIAITMPGLSDFGNVHWTATAFAYTSLVSGLLSTYCSFYVQQLLSDLHSSEDLCNWLTTPRTSYISRIFFKPRGNHPPDDTIIPQSLPLQHLLHLLGCLSFLS
jgi:hypothetical protein